MNNPSAIFFLLSLSEFFPRFNALLCRTISVTILISTGVLTSCMKLHWRYFFTIHNQIEVKLELRMLTLREEFAFEMIPVSYTKLTL